MAKYLMVLPVLLLLLVSFSSKTNNPEVAQDDAPQLEISIDNGNDNAIRLNYTVPCKDQMLYS